LFHEKRPHEAGRSTAAADENGIQAPYGTIERLEHGNQPGEAERAFCCHSEKLVSAPQVRPLARRRIQARNHISYIAL
jgi:hypothetical protein